MGWNSQKRGIGNRDTALSCKKYIKTAYAREHTFPRKKGPGPIAGSGYSSPSPLQTHAEAVYKAKKNTSCKANRQFIP